MRVVRNIGLVRRRQRLARIVVFIGLALLLGSMLPLFIAGGDTYVLFGYGALSLGFLTFITGMQQLAKWSRRPRADIQMDDVLNRLSDRYTFIHYPSLGARSPEHVLVTPTGPLVLTARDVTGHVTVKGNQWRKRGGIFGRFFTLGAPPLGNPSAENLLETSHVRDILAESELPGEVEGAVVFLSNNVEITLKEPQIDVLHVSELPEYVREIAAETDAPVLAREQVERIVAVLSKGDELETTEASAPRPKKKVRAA
jgi:hypothetical protein